MAGLKLQQTRLDILLLNFEEIRLAEINGRPFDAVLQSISSRLPERGRKKRNDR